MPECWIFFFLLYFVGRRRKYCILHVQMTTPTTPENRTQLPSIQDIQRETDNGRTADFYRVMNNCDIKIWHLIKSMKTTPDHTRAIRRHREHMCAELKALTRMQSRDIPYILSSDGNIHLYKAGCFRNITDHVAGRTTLRDRWIQALEYIRKCVDRPHAVGYIHCFASDESGRESTEIIYPGL